MDTQTTEATKKSQRAAAGAESEIRDLIDKYAKAFQTAKIDEILSFYSPDIVAFDMMPPPKFVGVESYRKSWEQGLSMMQGPWVYEPRDLKIEAGSDVAFSHALARIGGTTKEGKEESGWIRHTIGYRKINGNWKIVHEQLSTPVDMASGKALMNLKPEEAATTH